MSDDLKVDEFELAIAKIKEIHNRKKADYSSREDRYSNFRLAGIFSDLPPWKTFEVLIGVKQARLIELLKPGRTCYNEPIEDTLLDRAIYSILAYTFFMKEKHNNVP